jgi:8-oxo-dGTP diphosphatase
MNDEEVLLSCECGAKHWGKYGAAGMLIVHNNKVLLELRSSSVNQQPNTWGIPGGARRYDEDYSMAAYRETQEELGLNPGKIIVYDSIISDHGNWQFHTFLATTDEELEPTIDPDEVEKAMWVPFEKVSLLFLHKDFASFWQVFKANLTPTETE